MRLRGLQRWPGLFLLDGPLQGPSLDRPCERRGRAMGVEFLASDSRSGCIRKRGSTTQPAFDAVPAAGWVEKCRCWVNVSPSGNCSLNQRATPKLRPGSAGIDILAAFRSDKRWKPSGGRFPAKEKTRPRPARHDDCFRRSPTWQRTDALKSVDDRRDHRLCRE